MSTAAYCLVYESKEIIVKMSGYIFYVIAKDLKILYGCGLYILHELGPPLLSIATVYHNSTFVNMLFVLNHVI